MGIAEERVVAVIMVGGPTKGTRFRPLSFNIPKPLFPLAGQPMVHHPISACQKVSTILIPTFHIHIYNLLLFSLILLFFFFLFLPSHQIPNLAKIYLIGFYEEREFALYVSSISNDLKLPVRYLKEDKPHGSAGGLYNFKDLIMEEDPVFIFITYQFLHLLYANLLVLVLC
jgi:mannose-1-phosphate guanylyltransferase